MGCIIGNNKERIIDMNIKEIDYKSFRINNTQNDINKFLENEQPTTNNKTNNNTPNLNTEYSMNGKKITFSDTIFKPINSLGLKEKKEIPQIQIISTEMNKKLIITISNESNNEIDKLTLSPNSLISEKKNININNNNHIFSFGGLTKKEEENYDKEINYKIYDLNIKPHQFDIEYSENKFYLKDYKEGSGIFLKINPKYLIKENTTKLVFSLNNFTYLNIEYIKPNQLLIDYKKKKYKYNLTEKKKIKVGRSEECDLKILEEPGISRIQMTFFYNEKNNDLYVYDGNLINENTNEYQESTNGVWLLINKMEITNNMIIKSGMTQFFFELNNKSQ
jgi:hypothetical protein